MLQKHEERLQINESTTLTFASNRAYRGLRTQAQIDEKPVPDSKMPVSAGLNYCLLSSRSMVRIHQGALSSRYRSPDKTPHTNHTPPRAGFFIVLEAGLYRLSQELSPVRHWGLSQSPEAHQNFAGSTPELCSGVHQKGCDLEGVEGPTPHTSLTSKP